MKKIAKTAAASLFAAALVMGTAIPAFAETLTSTNPTTTNDVCAMTNGWTSDQSASVADPDNNPAQVISVDVAWGELTYQYNFGDVWDPSSHTYIGTEGNPVGWVEHDNPEVTVTNHSNIGVNASVDFTRVEDFTALAKVEWKWESNQSSAYLGSGAGLDWKDAKSAEFRLTPYGTPSERIDSATKCGTITVTIKAKDPESGSTTGGTSDGDDNGGESGSTTGGTSDGDDNGGESGSTTGGTSDGDDNGGESGSTTGGSIDGDDNDG